MKYSSDLGVKISDLRDCSFLEKLGVFITPLPTWEGQSFKDLFRGDCGARDRSQGLIC